MSYRARAGSIVIALVAAGTASLPTASGQAPPVYPDLVQEVPTNLSVQSTLVRKANGKVKRRDGKPVRRHKLGFRASAVNAGSGPLVVHAHRGSTTEPEMIADQLVSAADGQTTTVSDIGRYRYDTSGDHSHWHLRGFERYELRNASGKRRLRRSPKEGIGFCLGTRFRPDPEIVLAPDAKLPTPPFDDQCMLEQPNALSFYSGIHPGWSDPYDAYLEGQSLNLRGLKAGKYLLVHRVNPSRKIQEAFYNNNASSARIRLRYPRGMNRPPRVKVLRRCFAQPTC